MIRKYFIAGLLSLFIAGCGSSNSTIYIGKGEYLDSAVYGVSYECGSERGTTNVDGEFYYELGKECQFYLGNYIFKRVSAGKLKNGKAKIYEKDVRVARFLQILDSDGDASNGITISKSIIPKIPKSAYDFNDKGMSNLYLAIKDDASYNGRMVTKKEAQEHIDSAASFATDTLYAIVDVDKRTITQGESVSFDASSSKGDIESFIWRDGTTKIGSGMRFTTTELSIGNHTITLEITDKSGKSDKKYISITVLAPKTEWDLATTMMEKEGNKLLVRSDDANIYLKFQANNSMSDENISNVRFYINSDDSKISGLSTQSAGEGLDYLANKEGVFHLIHSEDFVGKKVQDVNTTVENRSLQLTIDRKNIEYLAKNITVSVAIFNNTNLVFSMKPTKKYKIPNYIEPNDTVAPVITLKGSNTVSIKVGDSYTDAGATAYDVVEGEISMSAPISDVDSLKPGVYQVKYKAEDSKHNVATKYRTVEVNGTSSLSTFEIKTIGEHNDTIAINHENGQIWMNDNRDEGENRGCLVVTTGLSAPELKNQIERFCKNSDFAGLTWRAPTSLELSKFSVKMEQEKKTVGMARKGCIRTLGIDSGGTVKAVNTHISQDRKQSLTGLIKTDKLTPAGARCVRGAIDNSIGEFNMKIKDGGKIIIDTTNPAKTVTWVNEYDKSKEACLAIHKDKPEELVKSKDFCKNLNYANYSNWRTPTPAELSNFIKKTNKAHILPGYEAPCKRLLAKDGNVSKAVYTRFDTTHTLGEVKPLEANLTSNIGLRCVRDN